MPMPWKKSKSGRISRFVSDLQQSPKHGGSLVVETGFPTSLIDLFVKNRDRLKKSSSKRNKAQTQQTAPTRRRSSSPPPPPLPLQSRRSLPQKLDPPSSVTEDLVASKIEESFEPPIVENRNYREANDDGGGGHGGGGGGGGCVLMVVVIKVFVVAVLALSTKKLAVGITISAFALLFLELAVARVLTLLNLCPDAQARLDSLFRKLIGEKRKENLELSPSLSSSSSSTQERKNDVSSEIIESFQESRDCIEEVRVPEPEKKSSPTLQSVDNAEERKVQTIRDVVFAKEKSKSAKLKSKIVKKIVPKKLRSYKKKKKMKKEKEEAEGVEVVEERGEEDESSVTEVSSLYSEDRIGSEISERDEIGSSPPLLESCEEIDEEEEEGEGSKRDLTKATVMIVIALAGLFSGKVFAICLTVSCCLILRFVSCKSQTSLSDKSQTSF